MDEQLRAAIQALTEADPLHWSSPDRERRDSVHALFQYPAMMVPIVQRRLIDVVRQTQPGIRTLYDPFVGAGTALVAGMYHGLDCYGQDLNPLALLVTRVKTGPYFHRAIRRHSETVLTSAAADESTELAANFKNLRKWFTDDVALGLSRLKRAILQVDDLAARRLLWVTLAETSRLTSNDRTSTYKLHARSVEDIEQGRPNPLPLFAELIERNLADLKDHSWGLLEAGYVRGGRYVGRVETVLADSSVVTMAPRPDERFDIVVTSPPYGDNQTTITYGQHSYLPLQWIELGDIDGGIDPALLRTTQEIDRRSLGGSLPRLTDERIRLLTRKSSHLTHALDALAEEPDDRSRRVAAFALDLDRCLLRIANAVRSNGYLIWTIGNRSVGGIEIPNDRIVSELFAMYGIVEVASIARTIHSKRMAPRNGFAGTIKSEQIVIFRQDRKGLR